MRHKPLRAVARTISVPRPFEVHHRLEPRTFPHRVCVGIAGFGTVGKATAEILLQQSDFIERRSGVKLDVTVVCRRSNLTSCEIPAGARYVPDWRGVAHAPDVDIVVETMGGTDEAFQLIWESLAAGKPVVTANKKLLAEYGKELFTHAASRNLPVGFEASVAASIPILRVIQESTTGDRIRKVRGILNGTCNYILTEMERRGIEFAEALVEAQKAGYAEADPSLDIDGLDARDKLCILTRMSFGGSVQAVDIPTFGIREIRACDIQVANSLNRTIRLIASSEECGDGVSVSVRPWLVERSSILAHVEGANNAVFMTGDRMGTQMFCGPGAGGDPTGSAVVSDLVDIARDLAASRLRANRVPGFLEPEELRIYATSRPVRWYARVITDTNTDVRTGFAESMRRSGIDIEFVDGACQETDNQVAFVTRCPVIESHLSGLLVPQHRAGCSLNTVVLIPME